MTETHGSGAIDTAQSAAMNESTRPVRAPAARARGAASRPLSILAWPAHRNRKENPYNDLLYSHVEDLGIVVEEFSAMRVLRSDVALWHIHWPEAVLNVQSRARALRNAAGLVFLMAIARLRGIRLVWTVHNLASHERWHPRLEKLVRAAVIRMLDGWIALSGRGRTLAQAEYPVLHAIPGFVTPHGDYRPLYRNAPCRVRAREVLELPAHAAIVGFVGQIRPYKNVDGLIRAFKQLADPQAVLLIAGAPKTAELGERIAAEAAGDSRIIAVLRPLSEEEIGIYARACNVLVLPYTRILNSATAILGLSLDVPVVTPDVEALQELADEVGPEWIRRYNGQLSAKTLCDAITWACARRSTPAPVLSGRDWRTIAASTVDVYRAIGCFGEN